MFDTLVKNLEEKQYTVHTFETGAQAAEWIDGTLDGKKVAFGGSMTLAEIGLYDKLCTHNDVYYHGNPRPELTREEMFAHARSADVYISSVNGVAETGELVNIDGTGNRVASTIYGHERVILVIGKNKIAKDYDGALWRARNIASPKNAQRLGKKTPCAIKGDKCYDCKSPERICRALTVFWEKPKGTPVIDVVIVNEELGY